MTRTILVADDSKTMRRCVELAFQKTEFRVVSAASAQEAIAAIQASAPDVILADVAMDGADGYQLCEALKRNPGTAKIPVVLLAGAFEPFDERRAAAIGASGHVKKPFDTVALVSRVKTLFGLPAEQQGMSTYEAQLAALRAKAEAARAAQKGQAAPKIQSTPIIEDEPTMIMPAGERQSLAQNYQRAEAEAAQRAQAEAAQRAQAEAAQRAQAEAAQRAQAEAAQRAQAEARAAQEAAQRAQAEAAQRAQMEARAAQEARAHAEAAQRAQAEAAQRAQAEAMQRAQAEARAAQEVAPSSLDQVRGPGLEPPPRPGDGARSNVNPWAMADTSLGSEPHPDTQVPQEAQPVGAEQWAAAADTTASTPSYAEGQYAQEGQYYQADASGGYYDANGGYYDANGGYTDANGNYYLFDQNTQQYYLAPQEGQAPTLADSSGRSVQGISRDELLALAKQVIEQIAWEVVPQLAESLVRAELAKASVKVSEQIAWEVVPELAETVIRNELQRLTSD